MARGGKRDVEKEAFWRRMLEEQAASGVSVRAWCERHGLRQPKFYAWRWVLARRDADAAAAGGGAAGGDGAVAGEFAGDTEPAFVPVRVTEDAAVASIEIVLAGGRRVRLSGPVDRQMLSDVLAVLEGRQC